MPWDNLYFYYGIEHLKNIQALSRGHDSDEVKILPFKIKFKAIALQFEHLHKIRSPVGQTCGFNIKEFDKVILVSAILNLIEQVFILEFLLKSKHQKTAMGLWSLTLYGNIHAIH